MVNFARGKFRTQVKNVFARITAGFVGIFFLDLYFL